MPDLISHTSQMRKSFMASHLLSEKFDNEPTAKTKNVDKVDSEHRETKSRIDSTFPDDENEEREYEEEDSRSSTSDSFDMEESNVERYDVHSALGSLDIRSDEDHRSTAILFHDIDKTKEENTKESPRCADKLANSEASLSLVQKRLQMFEASDKGDHADRKDGSKYIFRKTKVKESSLIQHATLAQNHSWDLAPSVLRANGDERSEDRLVESSKIKNEENFATVGKQQEEDLTEIERCKKNETSKDVAEMNNEERFNDGQHEKCLIVKSIEKQKEVEDERIEDKKEKDEEKPFEVSVENNLSTAKGIDLNAGENYPEDLNPFKSDEEDSVAENKLRTTTDSSKSNKMSTNPFDSDEDLEEEIEPPKPAARNKPENRESLTGAPTKRLLAAPQINLNPFWSDEEEERDSDLEGRDRTPQGNVPVPKPRTIKYVCTLFWRYGV